MSRTNRPFYFDRSALAGVVALAAIFAACRPAAQISSPSAKNASGSASIDPTGRGAHGGDRRRDAEPSNASDRVEGPAAPSSFVFVPRDINHVLSTGQSLAVGVSGAPALTLAQPFNNLMFTTGVMAGGEGLDAFEPLVEGDNIPGSKAIVETMSSSFANLVTDLSRSMESVVSSNANANANASSSGGHDILMSVHASGARTYVQLKKGTKYYANGMAQVTAARDVAKKLGKSYVVRAITNVHGESDHAELAAAHDYHVRNPTTSTPPKPTRYDADLLEWQADYENDIRALTGQTEPVPMFHTQISSWTRMMRGTATSAIPAAQLAAHLNSNGKVVLVGPKYHLAYQKDGVHLTAEGYRHMGEDYAKAYRRVVLEGKRWEPLRPIAITRDGAVITVKLVVPVPPIAIDTTLVSDPGNFGFEYTDSSAAPTSAPAIQKVEIGGPDTLLITLASVPTGDDRRLRYAFTGTKGARSGPLTGARGNLRDSDATHSRTHHRLFNWCIHFDEPVP